MTFMPLDMAGGDLEVEGKQCTHGEAALGARCCLVSTVRFWCHRIIRLVRKSFTLCMTTSLQLWR